MFWVITNAYVMYMSDIMGFGIPLRRGICTCRRIVFDKHVPPQVSVVSCTKPGHPVLFGS